MATSDNTKSFRSSNSQSMSPLVLVGNQNGVTVIPQPTPLTRLNYFDGKFLRASDLSAEQLYLRRLVDISNQGGGPGVVHGYSLSLAAGGDTLNLSSGLAIDPQGRVLLLPEPFSISVQELIDKSRQLKIIPTNAATGNGNFADCTVVTETPPNSVVQAGNLYLITLGFAEALCGQEDVFGKLCEEACATSTDRPFRVEGISLRATPLQLQTALPTSAVVALSQLHLRSRVASSYYEDERKRVASFISGDGLHSDVWCFGAEAAVGLDVPIGVIARAGSSTLFLDAWIARRGRIDTTPKRYWQWRMAMRPWDVFLAQILQFQCQLSGLFKMQPPTGGGSDDPCASSQALIREASATVAKLAAYYQAVTEGFTLQPITGNAAPTPALSGGLTNLLELQKRLQDVNAATLIPSDKFLIDGGIIELPSAGYLPVAPNSVVSVNEQVRRLLGKGVDLCFCIVRPDFVAHALEEAQHMERISLLQGLDDPKNKPKVDILVPNGEILEQKLLSPGLGFEAQLDINPILLSPRRIGKAMSSIIDVAVENQNIPFQGAARAEKLPTGGGAVYLGAEINFPFHVSTGLRSFGVVAPTTEAGTRLRDASIREMFNSSNFSAVKADQSIKLGAWVSLSCERNIFELGLGDTTNFNARGIVAATQINTPVLDIEINGILEITRETINTGNVQTLKGHIGNAQLSFLGQLFNIAGPRKTILVDLDATVTRTDGSDINIDLLYQKTSFIKLSANLDKQPLEVKAAISILEDLQDQQQEIVVAVVAAAGLKENADVLSANNTNHTQALEALDIIAAALRDVTFAAAKARLLFPPPPPPIDEILVRATADWVLFHRRRDKRCSSDVVVPEIKPPVSYRIFNITTSNLQEAQKIAKNLENSELLAETINFVSDSSIDLVIKFAGDSSQPLFDFTGADDEWKRFNPGKVIASVFYGNKVNDNAAVQTNRLRQFESAISEDSKENESTKLNILMPFPAEAVPVDADGIMLFITLTTPKTELLYAFARDAVREVNGQILLNPGPIAKIAFQNGIPEETNFAGFIAEAKKFMKVVILSGDKFAAIQYAWVARTTTPDPEAKERGMALLKRLEEEGLKITALDKVEVASLSEEHKKGIIKRLKAEVPEPLTGIDDVILIEFITDYKINERITLNIIKSEYTLTPFLKLKMELTIQNESEFDVELGEYYTNSVRFVAKGMVTDLFRKDRSYPEDLIKRDGLTVSDNSMLLSGQFRTVVLTLSGTAWDVPDKSFNGFLFFFDINKGRHIVEISPKPVPELVGHFSDNFG